MRFEKTTFTGETITPEGNEYDHCDFVKCNVVFTASSGTFTFQNCNFKECRFGLGGAARTTVVLLKALYEKLGPMGRDIVIGTYKEITGQSLKA
jgi:hypothetical protein